MVDNGKESKHWGYFEARKDDAEAACRLEIGERPLPEAALFAIPEMLKC
jgi:hypothetical protein